MAAPKFKPKMNVWRYLSLGYLVVILLGSVLLVLPPAAREGSTRYIDALFTAVSASCVTGLTPFDVNTHWTLFGQIVILLLIQLGGLGFMTFVSILLLTVKRGLSIYTRRAMMQSMAGGTYAGVKTLVKRIVIGSFTVETVGAALLCIRFIPDFGAGWGIYYSIFHAVSAFCNAGFDLMGGCFTEGPSLVHYARDPLVVLVVCALIILGGLGFCIWGDVFDCKLHLKKLQFYTKVILVVNSALLILGTLLFLLFERNQPVYEGWNFGERLLAAIFCSTTARTAGFYTVDPSALSESGYLLTVILMFIGGNSGSTAGGIKVGTFAVIAMGMLSVFRGRRDINIGKRRIDGSLLSQALAIFTAFLLLVLTATILICAVEPSGVGDFQRALFESVSALGTVGLSMSLTPALGVFSKLVLIVLMYTGRVGILTLGFALGAKRETVEVRRPVDTFFIG